MNKNITLKQVENDFNESKFMAVYQKFLAEQELTYEETIKLLSIAVLFLNSENEYVRKLGYHILVKYSISTEDFELLDDLSRDLINTPILKVIQKYNLSKNGILKSSINDMLIESSTNKDNENCYTYDQIKMINDFLSNDSNYMLVAPTSFGKSDLIFKYVLANYQEKNICIIVPTKALINQTRIQLYNLFKKEKNKPRIITHQDVVPSTDRRNIYIMTQERLYSVLFENEYDIIFDVLMIDEAHNLFENDERSKLLSKIIIYLKNKNENFIVKYFSPIIKDENSLTHKYVNESKIKGNIVQPLIKSENIYLIDFQRNTSKIYDRYFDKFISLNKYQISDYINFIKSYGSEKNIIYINSPKEIVKIAKEISEQLDEIDDKEIKKMITQISNYVNGEYDLIDGLKKGVIYHCGLIPDNIRIYIEDRVRRIKSLKYILCSSTLLEGVNMPFTTMFIFDLYKGKKYLTYHQLINLIGRVNRFNIIFSGKKEGLKGIMSNIYFIKRKDMNGDYEGFISERLKMESTSEKRNDQVENPFLKKAKETVEDVEKKTLSVLLNQTIDGHKAQFKTNIGKIMMDQNIVDVDLFKYEEIIENRIKTYNKNGKELIDIIYDLFIKGLPYKKDSKILILDEDGARHHYNTVLKWKKENQSFSQMITKQIYYWENRSSNDIYVGSKWGTPQPFGRNSPFVDKTTLNKKQLTNLAIIKVKEDLDYLDFYILRYIEVLYKIDFIDEKEYNLIKYGTNDKIQVFFIKEGLSQDLSKLLVTKYKDDIYPDGENYKLKQRTLEDIKDENEILVNELKYYIN